MIITVADEVKHGHMGFAFSGVRVRACVNGDSCPPIEKTAKQ